MSLTSSPAISTSRYSSPGLVGTSPCPSPVTTGGPPTPGPVQTTTKKPKPFNVFTNDGSFLERFQRSKQEEEERRRKEEDITNSKRNFESRFRNRGKRARPEPEDEDSAAPAETSNPSGGTSAKKVKVVGPTDQAPTAKTSKHN